ncbi:MAG: hypothetical protein EXR09_04690 [Acetobacteraceae bacterium]|nr:hypothetical protein [Acetobacteraceae bacterium]
MSLDEGLKPPLMRWLPLRRSRLLSQEGGCYVGHIPGRRIADRYFGFFAVILPGYTRYALLGVTATLVVNAALFGVIDGLLTYFLR